VKLGDIQEWPFHSHALFGITPQIVREMEKDERSIILAKHNLEVTQAELARCREAIRNGTIWELAEKRSHASPHLREAFVWLQEQLDDPDDGPVGDSVLQIIASTNPLRRGGEGLGEEIDFRPHILHIQALLATRWRVPGSWWDSTSGPPERVLLIEGAPPPWRISALGPVIEQLVDEPRTVVMISTPIGLVPFSLEDLSPWCHLTGPDGIWDPIFDDLEVIEALDEFGLSKTPLVRIIPQEEVEEHPEAAGVREWLDRCSVVDKLALLCAINPSDGCKITDEMTSRRSRTDRVVNVNSGGKHILSPRLTDGGISLTTHGASVANELNSSPIPEFGSSEEGSDFPGIPRVCIIDDAIPFVGKGRNVMHGYISGADSHLTPGQPCIVVDSNGALVAHGTPITTHLEMSFLRKGVAVKVREGAMKQDQ
jgi:7-cyano-7-deazaguanine tRNA-ribosyltransferase